MKLIKYISNIFKPKRIYNPDCGLDYRTWKEDTFGKRLCKDLDLANGLEGSVWNERNKDCEKFYRRHSNRRTGWVANYVQKAV